MILCLMQGVDQTLESDKVANHLENPENSHDPQKPDNLPSFPNDVKVLKPGEDDGEGIGDECHQVHLRWTTFTFLMFSAKLYQVHSILEKLFLVWRNEKPCDILDKEEADGDCVKSLMREKNALFNLFWGTWSASSSTIFSPSKSQVSFKSKLSLLRLTLRRPSSSSFSRTAST